MNPHNHVLLLNRRLPVKEPYPRMLLQAGLGDIEVPSVAAEALARAFNASVLPHNPKNVFGVPVAQAANETSDGPYVTFSELLYDPEYFDLPIDNTLPEINGVHFCVREDPAMVHQANEFINTGRVLDPCEQNACIRKEVKCSFWPR